MPHDSVSPCFNEKKFNAVFSKKIINYIELMTYTFWGIEGTRFLDLIDCRFDSPKRFCFIFSHQLAVVLVEHVCVPVPKFVCSPVR